MRESRLPAAGPVSALMVTLEMVADWASPDELLVNPTIQFVAAQAPAPASNAPKTMATPFVSQETRRPAFAAASCSVLFA